MRNNTTIILLSILCIIVLWALFSCRQKIGSHTTDTGVGRALRNGFSRQSDTIRFHAEALPAVDAQSFEILDDCYFRDKDHVYYYHTYRESRDYFTTRKQRVLKVEQADPASFVCLGHGYAKDPHTAWYDGRVFAVHDPASLSILNTHFAKDIKTAYLNRTPVAGSDGASFELLSDRYAKDARRYYYYTPTIDGQYAIRPIPCHYASFTWIDHLYARDDVAVYYTGEKIPDADPGSFEILGSNFAKDARSVFFQTKRIAGADPLSFVLFEENALSNGESVYAKDKHSIYVNAGRFAAADVATFKILNEKYTMDRHGVYYHMTPVRQADPESFRVFPHFIGDADAEDKHHRYGEGKVVE